MKKVNWSSLKPPWLSGTLEENRILPPLEFAKVSPPPEVTCTVPPRIEVEEPLGIEELPPMCKDSLFP
jgi:hypothetical protein